MFKNGISQNTGKCKLGWFSLSQSQMLPGLGKTSTYVCKLFLEVFQAWQEYYSHIYIRKGG